MLKLIYYRILAIFAVSGSMFYFCWNLFYIINGNVPPSIFYKMTGIPSPTTGMLRSFKGIIIMDIDTYFSNNPFVMPFLILLGYTFALLVIKIKNKRPLIIQNSLGIIFLLTLTMSEIWMLLK